MIRILILLLILIFISKKELFTNPKPNTKKIECNKKLEIKDFKESLNLDKEIKKDILRPTGVLPYNLNNTNRYNILNNFGIKNNKKRNSYFNNLNDNNTIAYNSIKLLNNYDKVLDQSFRNTDYSRDEQRVPLPPTLKPEFKDIYLISNKLKAQFSYDRKLLTNKETKLYIYYDIVNNCDEDFDFNKLKKLRLDKSINSSNDFNLTINHYNDRNIYKLEFQSSDSNNLARLIVVLKHDKKIVNKSNYVILKIE